MLENIIPRSLEGTIFSGQCYPGYIQVRILWNQQTEITDKQMYGPMDRQVSGILCDNCITKYYIQFSIFHQVLIQHFCNKPFGLCRRCCRSSVQSPLMFSVNHITVWRSSRWSVWSYLAYYTISNFQYVNFIRASGTFISDVFLIFGCRLLIFTANQKYHIQPVVVGHHLDRNCRIL